MKLKSLALAVSLALSAAAAQASIIDFNTHPFDGGNPILESGFTFNFNAAGWGVFSSGACCNLNYNGTAALYADGDRSGSNASSVMSLTGGGTFSVSAFDAASYWNGATGTLNVIGNIFGGGTVSASFGVNSTFQSFSLTGFNNLVSLQFQDSASGGFLSAPGFGVDNINLDPSAVPEPETYAMMLAGLGLLGFVARRRKRAAA